MIRKRIYKVQGNIFLKKNLAKREKIEKEQKNEYLIVLRTIQKKI